MVSYKSTNGKLHFPYPLPTYSDGKRMAIYNTKFICKKENREQHRVVTGPEHISHPAGQSTEWSLSCIRTEGCSQPILQTLVLLSGTVFSICYFVR